MTLIANLQDPQGSTPLLYKEPLKREPRMHHNDGVLSCCCGNCREFAVFCFRDSALARVFRECLPHWATGCSCCIPERAWVVQTSRNLTPDPETIVRKTNSKPETNVCKTAPDAVLHGLLRTVHRVGSDTEPQKKKKQL